LAALACQLACLMRRCSLRWPERPRMRAAARRSAASCAHAAGAGPPARTVAAPGWQLGGWGGREPVSKSLALRRSVRACLWHRQLRRSACREPACQAQGREARVRSHPFPRHGTPLAAVPGRPPPRLRPQPAESLRQRGLQRGSDLQGALCWAGVRRGGRECGGACPHPSLPS